VCGIIGYSGRRSASRVIVGGLRKLEYRGYDSFGIATNQKIIETYKAFGRISDADPKNIRLNGHSGIGHTRWATHGEPNDVNAHPHLDCRNRIAVVHNGIIENYAELKRELLERGHTFRSETDTEVIPHLIEENYQGNLIEAVEKMLPLLKGSFALLICAEGDNRLVAVKNQSPLVLGVGDKEVFASSDVTPLLEYTERVIHLEDGDLASLTPEKIEIFHDSLPVTREVELVDWALDDVKKGGFQHYMLKEIFEQPQVFATTVRQLRPEPLPRTLAHPDAITIVACGSSFHAGLIFKYLLESVCNIPARLELGSEFKYYTPPVRGVVIGITQSGETADTLSALKSAKSHNCRTIAITNVLGSTVTRITDSTLYMRAGPEISVAATKSFIAQIAVILHIISAIRDDSCQEILNSGNRAIEEALLLDLAKPVSLCRNAGSIFYVGRGPFYPVALEGALKMKEISYIHAEGYAAGELKHGPFALLSQKTPVVALCFPGETYPVMLSNIKEVKARGAPVLAIGAAGDRELPEIADEFIPVPAGHIFHQILAATVVLQLLAYHTADALGCDIDKPRNLAKSVTVE